LKNFLFSTTALAVAGALTFGSDANAAAKPIVIGLGGFMTHEMGFGENDGSYENGNTTDTAIGDKRATFNNVQDSEVYFTGSTKLDSGVTVSVTIQLEADQSSSGQNIDESYMKLTGGFGDLRLGSTTGTNSVLKHVAPNVGQHPRLGGSDAYISVPTAVGASNSTDANTSGDANKIGYISPVIGGGLRFGISYTPSTSNVNTAAITGGTAAEGNGIVEGAISFETAVGTSSVKADIAMEERDNDTRAYRAGLNVGFGGWTVGGSILTRIDRLTTRKNSATSLKGNAYDLGVTYAMGAYKFGLTKAYGEQVDGASAGVNGSTQDEQSKWAAGISYALDTGVTLTATYTGADYNDGATSDVTDNNEGHSLVGSIGVTF